MTTVKELVKWLLTFQPRDQVAINHDGDTLLVLGTEAYFVVGGVPEIGDEKPNLRNYKCPDCGHEWRVEASCHRDWDTCGACGRISMPIQE